MAKLCKKTGKPWTQEMKKAPEGAWVFGMQGWRAALRQTDQKLCLTPTAMARPESRSVSFSRVKAAYTLVRLDRAWS